MGHDTNDHEDDTDIKCYDTKANYTIAMIRGVILTIVQESYVFYNVF